MSRLSHLETSESVGKFVPFYQNAAEDQRYEAHSSFMQTSSKVNARQTKVNATIKGKNCTTAWAATSCRAMLSWVQPALSLPPSSCTTNDMKVHLGTQDTSLGRERSSFTALLLTEEFVYYLHTVAWIGLAALSCGQPSTEPYFMELANSLHGDTKGSCD